MRLTLDGGAVSKLVRLDTAISQSRSLRSISYILVFFTPAFSALMFGFQGISYSAIAVVAVALARANLSVIADERRKWEMAESEAEAEEAPAIRPAAIESTSIPALEPYHLNFSLYGDALSSLLPSVMEKVLDADANDPGDPLDDRLSKALDG